MLTLFLFFLFIVSLVRYDNTLLMINLHFIQSFRIIISFYNLILAKVYIIVLLINNILYFFELLRITRYYTRFSLLLCHLISAILFYNSSFTLLINSVL